MSDWRIHRREARCALCGRDFGEGDALFSTLFLEADLLRREDHCEACFGPPKADGSGILYWHTRHTLDRRARFAVDFQAIEELFLTLEGTREPARAELRYLLALLLLRKKRLKLVGVRRQSGGETLCLRRPRRQEEFEVQVFELDSARAAMLQGELARVFEGAGVEVAGGGAVPHASVAAPPVIEAPAHD